MLKPILLLLLIGVVAAIKYLPWWASIGLIVGLGVAGVTFGKFLFKRLFMGMFFAKSGVLKGATARIHSITAAQPPKPDVDDDWDPDDFEFEEPRHWVSLDVSIDVPGNEDTPMEYYDPSELQLAPSDALPNDLDDDREVGQVYGVEIYQDGSWVTCEDKVSGSARFRLLVAAVNGVDAFKLKYYFEILGNRA